MLAFSLSGIVQWPCLALFCVQVDHQVIMHSPSHLALIMRMRMLIMMMMVILVIIMRMRMIIMMIIIVILTIALELMREKC